MNDLKKRKNTDEELPAVFTLEGKSIDTLTHTDIIRFSASDSINRLNSGRDTIIVRSIDVNLLEVDYNASWRTYSLRLEQDAKKLTIACSCGESREFMCAHQSAVLQEVRENKSLRVFFDRDLRNQELKSHAEKYGVQFEEDLTEFFNLEWVNGRLNISLKKKGLLALDAQTKTKLDKQLLPSVFIPGSAGAKNEQAFLVVGTSTYTRDFSVKLYESALSKEGRPKNPLNAKSPMDEILRTNEAAALKMYAALARYQQEYRSAKADTAEAFYEELEGLKLILSNPLQFPVYEHDRKTSETVKADSIQPVKLKNVPVTLDMKVDHKGNFYELSAEAHFDNHVVSLESLQWPYRYFIRRGSELFLISSFDLVRVLEFFRTNNFRVIIHESAFHEFRETYLVPLESRVRITYSFVRPAPQKLIESSSLNVLSEKIIYLGDSEDYVLITPVIRYGNVEIPVRSKRQLITVDQSGKAYTVNRNEEEELKMLVSVARMHEDFADQEGQDFFYLHREAFMNEDWFLDAFDQWRTMGYTILGFSELKNNRLNAHKATVTTTVSSGIDWFDAHVKVSFGDQQVRLKDIQRSVANKSKYVQLGDGTTGILPEEWLVKFDKYLRFATIAGDLVRIPKSNFMLADELFRDEVLTADVRQELDFYREKINAFSAIPKVSVPEELQTTLRDYQKEGLNWLSFLDDFGFGGCLADDMGLGKTVQIIAFILKQREKGIPNTNLIVVPASLVFNWQQELAKFAPSVKVLTIHGNSRPLKEIRSGEYEAVLITYGTLVSDVLKLKDLEFNYIFLDESQNIKNPESQRYKAVRLLKARNRIALTGTPVENNTFDLYAQLSFAVPGLLGSKKQFRDHYGIPIDKFQDTARAKELQKRVSPFVLRRTKQQVATELPEKTEMVIYCEMGVEQQQVYDAYKKEFQLYLTNASHDDLKEGTIHILQGLIKLRQICNSPSLLNDKEYYGSESAKITELVTQIREKAGQHKILVFSQFVGMLDLIARELKKEKIAFTMLTGQTRNRKEVVESFKEQDENRVFLISLKAGGVGLNLTEADYVFIVDPWWNPSVENQAIDRAYRIGQQKHVMAVRLICPGTIEEKILTLQERKKELIGELVLTDQSMLKSLDRSDLLSLLD